LVKKGGARQANPACHRGRKAHVFQGVNLNGEKRTVSESQGKGGKHSHSSAGKNGKKSRTPPEKKWLKECGKEKSRSVSLDIQENNSGKILKKEGRRENVALRRGYLCGGDDQLPRLQSKKPSRINGEGHSGTEGKGKILTKEKVSS